MKAEVIAVGTELLMGETLDTNSGWLAARLPPLGIQLRWVTTVGDDLDAMAEALERAFHRSDLTVTTGGLGPTQDDLTREAIARLVSEEITPDPALAAELREWFRRRGMDMPVRNIKQAGLIPSAQALPNRRGTAPGWWVEKDGRIIVALPGPPLELQPMWEHLVAPRLRERARGTVILSRTFKTIGLSEAAVDEMVEHLYGGGNPYLGIYAKPDGIYLRAIVRAGTPEEAAALLRPMEEGIRSALGASIWGVDDDRPEEMAAKLLVARGLTLATAEACTGGLLAGAITEVAASASFYRGGLVADASRLAVLTGVEPDVVERHGAVSPEAAVALAAVARGRLVADVGLGVTGVVGPEEVEGKAVGTVYIGIAHPGGAAASEHHFPPRRELVKRRAVTMALLELCRALRVLR